MSTTILGANDAGRGPAAESARGSIIAGMAIVAVFFLGFGAWAWLAPLNGAVVAPAVIKVEGNRKSIQHLDGGVVSELLVKEGSTVKAGQVLAVLESTQAQAALDVLSFQHAALRAQEARLIAERDEAATVDFPSDLLARKDGAVARMMETETRQFTVRRTALTGQESVLRQRIEQLQEQIRGAEAQQAALRQELHLIDLELKDQYVLLAKNLTPRPKVLALERNAAALRGQQGEFAGNIAKFRQAIGEIELTIIQSRNDRMADVARELRETHAKVVDLIPRLQAAQDVLDRTRIRSPYAGQVVDLTVFSVGAVIQRGERMMDIVPARGDLIAELSVGVEDIHELRQGAKAEIRISGYSQRAVPLLHGTVIDIAADRLTDRRSGTPYYTALVRLDTAELAATPEIVLQPGMAATVMVPTTERTALDYLVGPLASSFGKAFRQR